MTVLVTGAAGAIGGAIARRLLADGEDVVAHDLRAEGLPEGARPLVGDLADRESLRAGLGDLDVTLDAVVAAHGIDGAASLADCDDAFVRRVLAVNAATLPELLEAVRPHLATPAAFVIVASQAGLVGEAFAVAYCAAKFAVVGWARAAAQRESAVAIRILCPGCTESPLLYSAQERFAVAEGVPVEEFLAKRRAHIPLGRFAAVEETAAAAVFLADPDRPRPPLLAQTGGEVLW